MTPVLIIGAIFAIIIPFISVKGAETKNADSSEDVPQSASYGRASSNNSLISQKDSPRPEYVTSDRSDAKNDQPSPTTASGASHGLDNSVTQKQPITSELPGPEHDFTRPAPNHAFEKLFQKFLNDAEPSKLQ